MLHLPPAATVDGLERDEIDIAISMGLDHSSSIRAEQLLTDRMVCIMRKAHPIAGRRFCFENFIAQQHLKISMKFLPTCVLSTTFWPNWGINGRSP